MAIVGEELKADLTHSLLNSLTSNLDVEALSPEDVAWVDSCLNKDVDAPDADWTSIKDALLEILSSQSEQPVYSSLGQSSMQLDAGEILHPREILTSMEFGEGSGKNEDPINDDFGEVESIYISDDEEDEDDEDNLVSRKKRSGMKGKILVDSVFRPNYSEAKLEDLDFDLGLSSTTNDVGTSSEDIFKVWDLGISDEQDDFTKQLNKALADVPSQIQLNTDDSTALEDDFKPLKDDSTTLKDLMPVTIDDIISGIGDLSLEKYS